MLLDQRDHRFQEDPVKADIHSDPGTEVSVKVNKFHLIRELMSMLFLEIKEAMSIWFKLSHMKMK